MKDIKLLELEKYKDSSKYEKVAEGIYKSLIQYELADVQAPPVVEKGFYVTAFSFTLEKNSEPPEDLQYPLEDILDKFLAHVSEFIQYDNNNPVMILELCTQGWLDEIEKLIDIAGKHIYNREIQKEGDDSYYELVIE